MIVGYCRVSTKLQASDGNSLVAQRKEILDRYPNALIYEEAYTGTTTDRPVFIEAVTSLNKNDTLVVTKLDRLARNTVEGIQIVQEIFRKKAAVHVLNVGLLEDTAMGQFFITTLLAVAQLERSQIIERTQTGRAIARTKPGYHEGRPPVYDERRIDLAMKLLEDNSYRTVSEMTGISISTLTRAKRRAAVNDKPKEKAGE